jgi:hypothetical protein
LGCKFLGDSDMIFLGDLLSRLISRTKVWRQREQRNVALSELIRLSETLYVILQLGH